jgi:hypothetical protein
LKRCNHADDVPRNELAYRAIHIRPVPRAADRRSRQEAKRMVMAADYPFMDIFWTMFVFAAWVIWFWLLIKIFADIFRRNDISGWGKAAWSFFVIVLPYLGVFVYLIAQGKDMSRRDLEQAQASRAHFDDYVRNVAATPSDGVASEIEKAKRLLDTGAITQSEFDAIKTSALARTSA